MPSPPRPRRNRLRFVLVGVTALAAASLGLAGPAAASGTECSSSGNACEYVNNGTAGNPFITSVRVWNPADLGVNETYRLLINGNVYGAASGTNGHTFAVNQFFNPGTCIQGGVLNLPDARTPCWYVP
jgi:hypothetical protein